MTRGDTFTMIFTLEGIVYNHKVYTYAPFGDHVYVWDLSGDVPRQDGYLDTFNACSFDPSSSCFIATTSSGQILFVHFFEQHSKWQFHIYKSNPVRPNKWVKVDSLGDEALILDIGFTVVANDISGIKRNSIYFSGRNYVMEDLILDHIYLSIMISPPEPWNVCHNAFSPPYASLMLDGSSPDLTL
ncbi:unnamed protein product [Arabis nemorensis]|uniref:KIB1-4 beta-propeller domain-containing protein n=1 Tax=Arabis nemorensis TaxID=586526 RepID=A0A565CFD9_9BRAS|nr:unnamed protein product [Arabis nemorensis]